MDNINHVKKTIESALADGYLSPEESASIKRAIYRDKKVTPEEAALWRELQEKVAKGEVSIY